MAKRTKTGFRAARKIGLRFFFSCRRPAGKITGLPLSRSLFAQRAQVHLYPPPAGNRVRGSYTTEMGRNNANRVNTVDGFAWRRPKRLFRSGRVRRSRDKRNPTRRNGATRRFTRAGGGRACAKRIRWRYTRSILMRAIHHRRSGRKTRARDAAAAVGRRFFPRTGAGRACVRAITNNDCGGGNADGEQVKSGCGRVVAAAERIARRRYLCAARVWKTLGSHVCVPRCRARFRTRTPQSRGRSADRWQYGFGAVCAERCGFRRLPNDV